jgi:hypothetical protein
VNIRLKGSSNYEVENLEALTDLRDYAWLEFEHANCDRPA